LNIKKIRLNPGLARPLRFLHVSDTHLSYADERDDERKLKLAQERSRLFEQGTGRCMKYLKEAIDYAKRHCDLLIHTGDVIDFVSRLNLDLAKEALANTECFFVAGNHEFSKYVGEAFEDETYKMDSMPLVQKVFRNNLRFDSMVIGGLNLVGMDNVYYHFIETQYGWLRMEVDKGLPILLMLHVPLYTPELYHESMVTRGEGNAGIMGCPEERLKSYPEDRYIQQHPNELDMEMIDYITAQPLIKAVFTGHKHYYHESSLSSGIKQYVAGAHFEGDAIEIEVV
jgi:UDP-2,3-diacylglucosamine pyrophosphatase LpxH